MKLAVTDANIFIDLFDLNLIHLLFEINCEIHTTDRVLLELYSEQEEILSQYKKTGELYLHFLTEGEISEIELRVYNSGLSETDKSVLLIAEKHNAMVLSGDDLVRKNCHSKKIEIHGILWLLDRFVEEKHIESNSAADHLEILMAGNPRLPIDHCNERINKWRN